MLCKIQRARSGVALHGARPGWLNMHNYYNVLLPNKRPHEKQHEIVSKAEITAAHFPTVFHSRIHPRNKTRTKPPRFPSTTITIARSIIPISKCFQCYGYIKKYVDSGFTAPRLLRLWVRIPSGHGCLSVVKLMMFN